MARRSSSRGRAGSGGCGAGDPLRAGRRGHAGNPPGQPDGRSNGRSRGGFGRSCPSLAVDRPRRVAGWRVAARQRHDSRHAPSAAAGYRSHRVARRRGGLRHRLFAARNALAGFGEGTRQSGRRWPRHAPAPGAPRLCRLVRAAAGGLAGSARATADGYRAGMMVLGLTGSIAMGKSTAAAMFRRLGVPVYDADRAVHRLLGKGGAAVSPVAGAFPGVVVEGEVDRRLLAARVFGDAAALRELEGILHPLVARERRRFLRAARRQGRRLVVLDIPLLFETGGERDCDAVAVVSAPASLQYARLLQRPGMSPERIAGIMRRQMPDEEKRRRADFVIPTGLGKASSYATIRGIVSKLLAGQRQRVRNTYKLRSLDATKHNM